MAEIRQLFSFAGRARRAEFWGVQVAVAVCSAIASRAVGTGPTAEAVLLAMAVLGTWATVAVTVRRLHDLNRSGWWIVAYYLAIGLTGTFFILTEVVDELAGLFMFLSMWSLATSIGLFVWIGFVKGTAGPNQFDADSVPSQTL